MPSNAEASLRFTSARCGQDASQLAAQPEATAEAQEAVFQDLYFFLVSTGRLASISASDPRTGGLKLITLELDLQKHIGQLQDERLELQSEYDEEERRQILRAKTWIMGEVGAQSKVCLQMPCRRGLSLSRHLLTRQDFP